MAASVGPQCGPQCGQTCHPVVQHNVGASILKDEDVLLVEHQRPWPGSDACGSTCGDASAGSARCSSCGANVEEYSLFAVFDGHNGASAARLAAKELVGVLEERLPQGAPPAPTSPTYQPWREDIQLALIETLAELNKRFALRGILAGCTATLVLQVGWLLTSANLGDSRAILDTGVECVGLTVDHRVATHKGERRRVEAMGNMIAPIDFSGSGPATRVDNGVGPLRIWPGGLCLSRAIGDFDVGDSVIPFPHIMQVLVPPTGARLLVASDGVWDAYEKMGRVGQMLRSWTLDTCPQRLIQSIVRAYGGLRDDTSLIVADILPPSGKSFPECAAAAAAAGKLAAAAERSAAGGGGSLHGGGAMCGCFGTAPAHPPEPSSPSPPPPPAAAPSSPEAPAVAVAEAAPGRLEILTDLDVAAVMGLMPEAEVALPDWYDEYVGEALFGLAAEAMESWQEANERRTGRRPATPQLDSSVRAARAARAMLEGEHEPLVDPEAAAWTGAGGLAGQGGMRRNASMFFPASIADADYADKFGHYKGAVPASLASGSPGSSMHGGGGASPGGSQHRMGGYRYQDASVRAGSRFQGGDASVRAGGRYLGGAGDVSVRAGTAGRVPHLEGVSVRAGSAYFNGSSGDGGSSGHGQRAFRTDPSIRSGTAALRFLSDSAGSAGGSMHGGNLAAAAAAAEAGPTAASVAEPGEHRRHGAGLPDLAAAMADAGSSGNDASAGGSGSGASSPPDGSGHGAPGGSKNGGAAPGSSAVCASAPIPVPRNVSFGAVKVLGGGGLNKAGGGGGPEDSPMDHSSTLAPAAGGSSGQMDTILEG